MDGKEVSGSYLIVSEGKSDSFYPMYFGVSCAFFALKVLTRPDDKEDDRWSDLCEKMLHGSAQLLGLLVWKVQREGANGGQSDLLCKLEAAEKEIMELKKIRREDAKANEKVVSIYASQEQSWFIERKMLRHHIGGLMNELRVLDKKNEEAMSELNEKLKEMELFVQSKDKAAEEEEHKRKELEEKLVKAEKIAEELRETAKREAQEHATDIWKHKTAFLELVSNQRQLEAEMGRALRQLEAKKQELDVVLEQKEEAMLLTQKLSMEVLKMRKDFEQKDKILSAMLRKSKLDTTEKQMLLKEVKLSKAKKKQAELETERWKSVSESKHERHSLRSMFSHHNSLMRSEDPPIERGASQVVKGRISQSTDYDLEYENPEFQKNSEVFSPLSNFYSPEGNDELANVKRLEGWVRSEAEKYAAAIEKRHHLEIDAFAEQMRLKDEKLEAFRWRILSMEIESKRLQSHIEGLNRDVSQIRHENMKLEALLLERQEGLTDLKEQLKEQLKPQFCQMSNLNSSLDDPALVHDAILSKTRSVKREPIENDQETKVHLTETSQEKNPEKEEEEDEEALHNQSKNVSRTVQSPEKEFEEEKDVANQGHIPEASASPVVIDTVEKLALTSQSLMKTNNSPWRMDLHALGVSYKLKRLKQQLLMLERLTGKQESSEHIGNSDEAKNGMKGFQLLMSLLNKQVNRYQSLQGKTDELCKRMHDSDVDVSSRDSSTSSTAMKKGETKTLEHFLEETFQVQRYMVAAGQKMVEVQSKIASGFADVPEELEKNASSSDLKRFADNIKTLFQEVQRGLEVRIARIIGDLEGTLACEGMIRMRR